MKRFFFHYNKPASLAAKCPKMSIHFNGGCHIVDHVECYTWCESKHRNRQPRCVMQGHASDVTIHKVAGVVTGRIIQ